MVGFDASDAAAVYRINDDTAMIQTADFFPPVVDDPRSFGRIAAANALSDVYAMGGTPRLAINLLCFPTCLNLEIVREILAGGADKVVEAGAVIAGGHSIEDTEPKYGLCVTGFARPEEILTNSGAKPGDLLVLTKPVGTGVLSTAEAISLLANSMALAGSFGSGTVTAEDLAAALQGAVIKDEEKDRLAWKEYLENVMKKRGSGWLPLYRACRELEP